MTAKRLRQAAARLREVASSADQTPWGWRPFGGDPANLCRVVTYPEGEPWVVVAEDMEAPNAEYVATMHPPVALALADWLDSEEYRLTRYRRRSVSSGRALDDLIDNEFADSLAVADAILGEA